MKKRVIIILIVAAVVLIAGIGFYFSFDRGEKSYYEGSENDRSAPLVNPAEGLSLQEAAEKFDESFVYYILVNIGAYNLHKPFFGDNPKIELYVGEDVFNAEIIDGSINVRKGEASDKDIIIRTTKEEGARMTLDENYISESFANGQSSVELIAGSIELAAKGYLSIYDKLAG